MVPMDGHHRSVPPVEMFPKEYANIEASEQQTGSMM